MKATLEFTLPEENTQHYEAVNGATFRYCLQEVDEELRVWIKHGHKFSSADDALENVRKVLHDLIQDNDIVLH
jgi:transposase